MGIPFSYHANWGSKDRWALEAHTREASYRLCPMEGVQRKEHPLGEWDAIELTVAYPEIKIGIAEMVAVCLGDSSLATVVWDGPACVELTRFGEAVFGYEGTRSGVCA